MINIDKEKCTILDCPCNKYEFDICDEFDCNRDYCIKTEERDCEGKYWKDTCIFHGEHLELNINSHGDE